MLKVAMVISLSGPKEKIGHGMVRSLELGIELGEEETATSGLVELSTYDDFGSPHAAIEACRNAVQAGCAVIVGPADSDSMKAILDCGEFDHVPVLSTIATSMHLTQSRRDNFFRLTTPDATRVQMLVQTIRTLYPDKRINVYAKSDTEHSYAQSLKRDVVSYLDGRGVDFVASDYSTGEISVAPPGPGEPVIICAASADAVRLCEHLRAQKRKNQVFGLGSNSNWLQAPARGGVVVADLDRNSADPQVRGSIEHLERKHGLSDPSLPTVNAGYIIATYAAKAPQGEPSDLGSYLRSGQIPGIFGPLNFTSAGEMAGFEQIVPLKIQGRFGRYRFMALKRKERPTLHDTGWARQLTLEWLGIIGGVASLLGLAFYVFDRFVAG